MSTSRLLRYALLAGAAMSMSTAPGRVSAVEPRLKLTGHAGAVQAVAFSPDGKVLASAGFEAKVRLWAVADGKPIGTLAVGMYEVRSLAISPDGKWLAAGDGGGAVRLWDMATSKEHALLPGHGGLALAVAFSPDSKTLACGGGPSGILKLWHVAAGKERATLKEAVGEGRVHYVQSVAFSSDGETLASGGGSLLDPGELKLWDVATGKERASLKGHKGRIWSVAFSSDGKTLAAASLGPVGEAKLGAFVPGELKLWDVAKQSEKANLKVSTARVSALAFGRDGRTLVSGGGQPFSFGELRLWNDASARSRGVFSNQTAYVYAVALSPDGATLAAGGDDGMVRLWPVPEDVPVPDVRLVAKELQGDWRAVAVEVVGRPVTREELKGLRLRITGDEATFFEQADAIDKTKFTLDTNEFPHRIDLTLLEGDHKGKTYPGLISWGEDRLRICFDRSVMAAERPREFRTDDRLGKEMWTLERVK